MLERNLQRAVLDLCKVMHLRTAHFRSVRTTRKGTAADWQAAIWTTPVAGDGIGFPDLVIVGPGGVLFRELKTERGTLGPEQRVWRDCLLAAGADWAVWRPVELTSGLIHNELKSISKPKGQQR